GVDVPTPAHAHIAWSTARVVQADWPDWVAVDVVGPGDAVRRARDALVAAGAASMSDDDFEVARITAGIPRLGVDLDERTIPQEAFLERDAVSFTKGCYLGQELVARIDTRGHVNRYLRRLEVEGDATPDAGAAVVADGREVGAITSAAAAGPGR